MKKVSIVVLTYNNIDMLNGALMSIKSQTYENIEVLISDDCSSKVKYEDIVAVVEQVGMEMNVQIHVNECNLGTVKNFNGAIKRASGEYIFPLSCDDKFADERVVWDIVTHMDNNNMLICTAYRKGCESGEILPTADEASVLKSGDRDLMLARLAMGNIVCGATLYYRRKVFDEYGFFDEKYDLLEDYPYIFAFLKKGGELGWYERTTIIYGESGVSSKGPDKPVNPRLKKDAGIMTKEDILPSADAIKDKRIRRVVEYRKKKHEGNHSLLLLRLQYIDLSFMKLIKMLKRDKRNIFWTMYKGPKK